MLFIISVTMTERITLHLLRTLYEKISNKNRQIFNDKILTG